MTDFEKTAPVEVTNSAVAENAAVDTAAYETIKSQLILKQDGLPKQSMVNCRFILENDPVLKEMIKKNEMSGNVDIVGKMPWARCTMAITDTDINYIAYHFEKYYDICNENSIRKAIDIVANENKYHPVKEKLKSLKWDGVARIRHLLPKYLGTEESDYIFEATRLLMLGAINRVFDPGCKFEYMICLVGGQGAGKSSFMRLLAMEDDWFSDDIKKLDDKELPQKIHGHWIMEMAEMLATCKMQFIEEIKTFLSKQIDAYRMPYDRYVVDRPRQCVFVGTTNNYYFLPFDRTGNRRFVPVEVDRSKAEHHPLENKKETRAFIEQCWAEAMIIYKSPNNKLVFNEDLMDKLLEMQKKFMPEDTMPGMLALYLENSAGDFVCSKELYKYALHNETVNTMSRAITNEINNVMRYDFCDEWRRVEEVRRTSEFGPQKGWERIKKDDGFKPVGDGDDVPFEQLKLEDSIKSENSETEQKV